MLSTRLLYKDIYLETSDPTTLRSIALWPFFHANRYSCYGLRFERGRKSLLRFDR